MTPTALWRSHPPNEDGQLWLYIKYLTKVRQIITKEELGGGWEKKYNP